MEQATQANPLSPDAQAGNTLERMAARVTRWAETWFPDAYIFAAIAAIVVALGALAIGAPAQRLGIA